VKDMIHKTNDEVHDPIYINNVLTSTTKYLIPNPN